MKNIKYDTTKLLAMIKKKYSSKKAFCMAVTEKTGKNWLTVRDHIDGLCVPTTDEIAAFASLLGTTVKEIAEQYDVRLPKKTEKKVPAPAEDSAKDCVRLNYDALIKATQNAGLTGKRVADILGISPSSYHNWSRSFHPRTETLKRVAMLLGVKYTDLIIEEEETKAVPATNKADKATAPSTVVSSASYKEIGDTQNIHEIFAILNENIITLGNTLNAFMAKQDAVNSDITLELSRLKLRLSEANLADKNKEPAEDSNAPEPAHVEPQINVSVTPPIKKPVATPIRTDEVKSLYSGFSDKDSYDIYRMKVNRMVHFIAIRKKCTHKQMLHKYYKEMTNTYGCVYDQLKKDYYAKYQHRDSGSMELIYEEPIFREIYYNMIAADLKQEFLVTEKA